MLDELNDILSKFDSADLLTKVGVLHLEPANASRAISLDALAHLVAGQAHRPNAPKISKNRLTALLETHLSGESMPAIADDPAEQMFTEELLFSGGSYVVFPGPSASEQDILNWLLRAAVLRNPPLGPKLFRDEVSRAAVLCLSASDGIARKAGIGRGECPERDFRNEIRVPASGRIREGMAAVTFTRDELARITHGERFFATTIEPLTVNLGDADWSAYSFEFGQLHHTPFVKAGDKYIVPVPSLILPALRHRILCIAQEHGVLSELMETYRVLIWTEIDELLGYWKSRPIPMTFPDTAPTTFVEGLFSLDSDKALYVQLATDGLSDFAGEYEPSLWDVENLSNQLEERASEVVQHLSVQNPAPDRVLILTILQPVGRSFAAGFGELPGDNLGLVMSASALRTITLSDAGDPLGLWKFARAHHQIRKTVQVIAADILDEYENYRASQHSYYLSDDRLPTVILIAPGDGLQVRRRMIELLDPHGVPSFHLRYLVEVWSVFGSGVPIFSPPSQLGKQLALVVEGELPIPVWVISPESIEEEPLRGPVGELVETLAYWLWQFEAFLAPVFGEVAGDYSTFVIQIDLDNPSQWAEVMQGLDLQLTDGEALISRIEPIDGGLKLYLHVSLLERLGSADNQGERVLIQELLLSLRETLETDYPAIGRILSDSRVEEAIEQIAPLGQKKKIVLLPLGSHHELDPANLPNFRAVQEAEFAELLDGVGEHIRSMGWKEGEIPADKMATVLNEAVDYLYNKLRELVAKLDGAELLPALIACHEANTRELFHRRFFVPTRLACFGQREELVKKLMEEIPEADAASLANRFLVEYVAARPPTGDRRLSLETFDQLMAVASEIINWGMLSDFVHFNLAAISLSILPSGRLGFDREAFLAAQRDFLGNHLGSLVSETQRSFATHWSNPSGTDMGEQPPPRMDELDQAFSGEFGFTLTELTELMTDIYSLGTDQSAPAKQVTAEELVADLSRSLDWEPEKVRRGITFLSLGPRDDFLTPPDGSAQEAYPWRFNRAWSYLRRPLVSTGYGPDSTTLWGNRHLVHAMRYLIELCLGGRLKADTLALKQVIGKWREDEAKSFEESVAQIISEATGVLAKLRLRKVGKRRIVAEGKDLGDIDVLGVIPSLRVVLAIECKDLALARTPVEIQHQLEELVIGSSNELPTVAKHSARARWVEDNLDQVLLECFDIKKRGRWKVQPLLVSDSELHAPYLARIPFPVFSIETLKRTTIQELVR